MQGKFITGSAKDMQYSDYNRFFNRDPDGFSAERNKYIVEKTIQDYDKMRAKKAQEHDDSYMERADAVVTYLRSLENGGSSSNIERYFGKKTLAYLRGQQIRDRLMEGMMVKDRAGHIIKP